MVSMLSMPPQATMFPLGANTAVMTHADLNRVVYIFTIESLDAVNIYSPQRNDLSLVACPAVPDYEFAVQGAADSVPCDQES